MTKFYKASLQSLFLIVTCILLTTTSAISQITLDQNQFSATGNHQTLVSVTEPGMYHIEAQSGQGSRLELVDRMNGIIAASGNAGRTNGRLDIILDIGTYRLSVFSVKNGQGDVKISATPYKNAKPVTNISEFPVLKKHQLFAAKLQVKEKISYWIHQKKRTQLNLEAIGRNLNTCLLWKNGKWLSDIKPSKNIYEVKSGQPMTYVEFHKTLNPGLYLLTCYGSIAKKWASDDSLHPFFLRMGIPELAENGLEKLTVSPFGRDTYLVPKTSNFFQLSRDQKKETSLIVHSYQNQQSRFKRGYRNGFSKITKKSKVPWCKITTRDSRKQVVIVQSKPGDILHLRYLNSRFKNPFYKKRGRFWLSAVESIEGLDSLEFTPYVLDNKKLTFSHIPEIGPNKTILRKINLFGKNQFWIYVQKDGRYQILENRKFPAKGSYTIYNNRNKKVRPVSSSKKTQFAFKKGYYSLTVSPRKSGILEMVIAPKQLAGKPLQLFDNQLKNTEALLPKTFVYPAQNIKYSNRSSLKVNKRHQVAVGIISRKLPLRLTKSLPVQLNVNQQVSIELYAANNELLEVTPNQKGQYALMLDGKPIQVGDVIPRGAHKLLLKNSGVQKDIFIVKTTPQELNTLDQASIEQKIQSGDIFKNLIINTTLYEHFERQEQKSLRVDITEPGIYRLETEGRLQMRLNLRTTTITNMMTVKANGIGRNALIQQYLKAGIYFLTAQTQGKSAGAAGIKLTQLSLETQSELQTGDIQRQTIEANVAVIFPINIGKAGIYQINTQGNQKTFQSRFEDNLGWPLVKPGLKGSIKMQLAPGKYWYYSLPSAIKSIRITTIKRLKSQTDLQQERQSKIITLNKDIRSIWRETPDRQEDRYELSIPAELDLVFYLSKNFEATLLQENSDFQYSFKSFDGNAHTKSLKPGKYFIHINSIEVNDKVPYHLTVKAPGQLAPGLSQNVAFFPTKLSIRLAEETMIDISSFGSTDISARLFGKNETNDWQLISENDDRESDWNFLISRTLPKGEYQLQINAESSKSGTSKIEIVSRSITEEVQQVVPFSYEEVIENDVIEIPFTVPEDSVVKYTNDLENIIQLQIYKDDTKIAEAQNNLLIPLKKGQRYTLRLWQLEVSRGPVKISGSLFKTQSQDLLSGQESRFKIINQNETALRITTIGAYGYHFSGRSEYYHCAYEFEKACQLREPQVFYFNEGNGWVVPVDAESTEDIQVSPFQIEQPGKIDLKLSEIPMLVNIKGYSNYLTILNTEAVNNQVGINLSPEDQTTSDYNWNEMAIIGNTTLSATDMTGSLTAKIWTTNMLQNLSDTTVHLQTLPVVDQFELSNTNHNFQHQLLPQTTHLITTKHGPKWLKTVLEKGLKLVKIKSGLTTEVISAEKANQVVTVRLEHEKIYIFNLTAKNKIYRLEQQYQQQSPNRQVTLSALNPGFSSYFETSGSIKINVEELISNDRVYINGNITDCMLLGIDGKIESCHFSKKGNRFRPGQLFLKHTKGLVNIWMGDNYNDFKSQLGKVVPTSKPLLLNHGDGTLRNETSQWELSITEPQLVVINHTIGGLTYIQSDKKIIAGKTSDNARERQVVHYLEAGEYRIITKPLPGLVQNGKISVRLCKPEILTETENRKLTKLIAPDEFKLFTFNIKHKSQIGSGVYTASDNIHAQLYNTQFQLINEGPIMVNPLETGNYMLIVHPRDTDHPILYQPLLYGSKGSEQGIPQSILDKYVK